MISDTVSMVDRHHPDLERHPRFAEAMKVAQSAELEPGDAIYLPYHWWHGVDSLEPVNLFVNYRRNEDNETVRLEAERKAGAKITNVTISSPLPVASPAPAD